MRFFSALLLIALLGCADDTPPRFDNELPECPEDSVLTYENFGRPFLLDWCTGCHSSELANDIRGNAPEDLNFDDPNMFRPYLLEMYDVAADENLVMPPVGGPGSAERHLFGEWIACGAPSDYDVISE